MNRRFNGGFFALRALGDYILEGPYFRMSVTSTYIRSLIEFSAQLLNRLTFTPPSKSEVRSRRRDSYIPDIQLEQEAQEILSLKEKECDEQRLEKIDEGAIRRETSLSAPSREYLVTDIKARRNRQFRSSVYVKVKGKDGRPRSRRNPTDDN